MSDYDDNEVQELGPTGPDETWQEGDHAHTFAGCVRLTAASAKKLNDEAAERKAKTAAAEFTRLSFQQYRPCPKCKVLFPASIDYVWEGSARCAIVHGATEHIDRTCLRCGYIWAENLP